MPPSERANLMSGYERSTGDHTRSAAACTMLIGVRVMRQSIGASGAVITCCDEDPMWSSSTTPSSEAASHTGFQWSEWKLGQPSLDGFSEKVRARAPLAATRLISAAMISGSQMGGIGHGMNRPGYAPHHASRCQSL